MAAPGMTWCSWAEASEQGESQHWVTQGHPPREEMLKIEAAAVRNSLEGRATPQPCSCLLLSTSAQSNTHRSRGCLGVESKVQIRGASPQ